MDRMTAIRIRDGKGVEGDLGVLARFLATARRTVALTGAGVSVASGIPDFRSPGGLWAIYEPARFATRSCFVRAPEAAWEFYRALGATIAGRKPNEAHRALVRLEQAGHLSGIVTQNIDGLHQAAGSENVMEIHGEGRRLQCLACGALEPFLTEHLEPGPVPRCAKCRHPLKPNVVLFDEPVRDLPRIRDLLRGADAMLVAGTSGEVAPASELPEEILANGGSLVEFNLVPTRRTAAGLGPSGIFVEGPVAETLPAAVRAALRFGAGGLA